MNPFTLPGPDFLALWLPGAVAVVGLSFLVRWLVAGRRASFADLDALAASRSPIEVAYLACDLERAIEAAIAGLVHRGELVVEQGALRTSDSSDPRDGDDARWQPDGVYRGAPGSHAAAPIERFLLDQVRAWPGISVASLISRADGLGENLRAELEDQKLMVPTEPLARIWIYIPGAAWLAFGGLKALIGLSRGRPVGILIVLLAAGCYALTQLRMPRLTARGAQLVRYLTDTSHGLAATATSAPQQLSGSDVALAYALFGFAAAPSLLAPLMPSHHAAITVAAAESTTVSSCGSSCGSGCGSGCGGGCGGCS